MDFEPLVFYTLICFLLFCFYFGLEKVGKNMKSDKWKPWTRLCLAGLSHNRVINIIELLVEIKDQMSNVINVLQKMQGVRNTIPWIGSLNEWMTFFHKADLCIILAVISGEWGVYEFHNNNSFFKQVQNDRIRNQDSATTLPVAIPSILTFQIVDCFVS